MSSSNIVIIYPTPVKIENCKSMGWEYVDKGKFIHCEDNLIGYFTKDGFVKEET